MAAQVRIESGHVSGNSVVFSEVSSIRFKMADNDSLDNEYPLVKPTSGTTYSWEKVLRLNVTTGPSNSLNNLRFHRVSDMPGGITDVYGEVERVTPDVPPQPAGNAVSTKATKGLPRSAGSGVLEKNNGQFAAGATGQYGPYIVLQWQVSQSATAGTTAPVTYRWTFDEA